MTELPGVGTDRRTSGWLTAFPLVQRATPAKLVRLLGTATLLERIRANDPTLQSVRLDYELLPRDETMQALLGNNTISSVVISRVGFRNSTAVDFSHFLESLYHLPLRSVQIQDGGRLASSFLDHLLYLVEYCSGVGKACKWTDGDYYVGGDFSDGTAAAEMTDVGASCCDGSRVDAESAVSDYKTGIMLEFLDISGCRLTERHAQWLGNILFHRRCTLRHVNVCECHLGNKGLRALFSRVATSPRLEADGASSGTVVPLDMIELRWNGVTEDESLRTFMDEVEANTGCWACVTVYGNYISPQMYARCETRLATERRRIKAARRSRRGIAAGTGMLNCNPPAQPQVEMNCSSRWYFVDLLTSVAEETGLACPALCAVSSLLHDAV